LDWWRLLELEAEAPGDLPQRVIEVRQMIDGHVAHEGAAYFVVTRATVQPPQKDEELDAGSKADNDPVWVHGSEGAHDCSSVIR